MENKEAEVQTPLTEEELKELKRKKRIARKKKLAKKKKLQEQKEALAQKEVEDKAKMEAMLTELRSEYAAHPYAAPAEAETAITVRDLKIRYRSFKKLSIKKTLFKLKKNETELFEAIKGISFDVKKGQILGVVGKNGSGKSTLLRALAGIFSPDEGSIDLHGYTISLLALGAGFEKKLTGRENIVLVGMLLGFHREEIEAKMKQIIKFSELGEFIDKPVSTYSSGMYSKLAFSITVNLETEIMLIDEVLSVGDARFKRKSAKKMKELIQQSDRTVVIVSHSMNSLSSLCDTILWLHDGEIVMQGPADQVLPKYDEFMGIGS